MASEPYVWKGVRVVSGDKVYRVTCTKTTSGCLRGTYKFPGNRKCCLPNMCQFAELEEAKYNMACPINENCNVPIERCRKCRGVLNRMITKKLTYQAILTVKAMELSKEILVKGWAK